MSRRGLEYRRFDALRSEIALEANADDAVLDGEIVKLDPSGGSIFIDLMKRRGPFAFVAFDVLAVNSRDVRKVPLVERKKILRAAGQPARVTGGLNPAGLVGVPLSIAGARFVQSHTGRTRRTRSTCNPSGSRSICRGWDRPHSLPSLRAGTGRIRPIPGGIRGRFGGRPGPFPGVENAPTGADGSRRHRAGAIGSMVGNVDRAPLLPP